MEETAVEFTREDRNLLIRVAVVLRADADGLERAHGTNWGAAKIQKREHDRLRRDERDLVALRRRLEALAQPTKPAVTP